jgi:hypothetical protein
MRQQHNLVPQHLRNTFAAIVEGLSKSASKMMEGGKALNQ